MSGQDCRQLTLFPADSPASLTVLQEKGREKRIKEICGRNLYESLEKYSPDMLLVRTCLAFYLQFMTAFAPTWKEKITKSGRSVYRLTLSVPTMRDIGWLLLPSTRASQDFKPIRKQTPQEHCKKYGNTLASGIGIICPERIGQYINPRFSEWLMGFPEGWTDV